MDRRGRGRLVRLPGIVAVAAIVLGALGACGRKEEVPATPTSTPIPPVQMAAGQYAGDPLGGGCWTQDQVISAAGERPQWSVPPAMVIDTTRRYVANVSTNKGAFDVELLVQEAPTTANNFVCLSRAGYYDDTRFHRIVVGFVIQGGDPTGTGSGGPGYTFQNETPQRPYARGTVAMANSGPDTNGSQFFVCLDDLSQRLGPDYTLFGNVVSGMEVVDAIAAIPAAVNPSSGEQSSPLEEAIIQSVTISEQ